MLLKKLISTAGVIAMAGVSLLGQAAHSATPDETALTFASYAKSGFPEQDAFVESATDATQVIRLLSTEAQFLSNINKPAFAAAAAVPHDPYMLGTSPVGPFPKGMPLGMTMSGWLGATGSGKYVLTSDVKEGEKASLRLTFHKLVPSGLYTILCARIKTTPNPAILEEKTCVSADGSESSFTADAKGDANFTLNLKEPLTGSSSGTFTTIGLDYHSDGKTCGENLCGLGLNSHVQLIAKLPSAPEMSKATCLASAQTRKAAALTAARTTLLKAQSDARKTRADALAASKTAYNDAVKKANTDRRAAEATARDVRKAALDQARTTFDEAMRNAQNNDERELAREARAAAQDKAASDFDLAMATALKDSHAAMNKAIYTRHFNQDKAQSDWDQAKDKAAMASHEAKRLAMSDFHAERTACMQHFLTATAPLAPASNSTP